MSITVGIDNGLKGALAVNIDGKLDTLQTMPTIKDGKSNIVDILMLQTFFEMWRDRDAVFFAEIAGKHSPGKLALCSTWRTFGHIEALLVSLKCRREFVQPQRWQKTFWVRPKMPKGQKFDTKAAALKAANQIWPDQDWRASARCTNPHDGLVDAALISEYGRRIWR